MTNYNCHVVYSDHAKVLTSIEQDTDTRLAEAASLRYSSKDCCGVVQLKDGSWCLFDYARRPIYIGPWDGLELAYRARPMPSKPETKFGPTKAERTAALIARISGQFQKSAS